MCALFYYNQFQKLFKKKTPKIFIIMYLQSFKVNKFEKHTWTVLKILFFAKVSKISS